MAAKTYDARRRRERAEEERAATRRRVVEAARRLFLTRGYIATTIAAIAEEAGVALQSVYNAGQSKADLLHLVTDVAVAGDDQDVMLLDRPSFQAVSRASSPEEQIRTVTGLVCTILERLAPVWVAYREAAAVDPKAAANLVAAHKRRHATVGGIIRMLPEERLRRSVDESTDTVWAIGSIDVFLLLRSLRGWDAAQYSQWLERTLLELLLVPAGDATPPRRRGR